MKIPLIKPYITQEIKDKVCEVLDSGYLTEGPITKEFEKTFESYIGCRKAIAVTSCTTGLEMALRAMNITHGDEVIVPDYTYPATADVVAIVGATAVIVDVSKDTMLINYDALEKAITTRTKAVIAVSLFGNPLDYDRLDVIRHKYEVHFIEDAACAIGAEYKGVKVGNFADVSVFSLHPRKFITTGEGGMVTTNNLEWAAWMESYKHFGMGEADTREGTVFARIGTNYKLSNILAAVGLVQMQHIEELLNKRIELANRYRDLLTDSDKIRIPETTVGGKHSYQSFCVFVEDRDRIMKHMRNEGIEVQIGSYAIHMHPAFSEASHIIQHEAFIGSQYVYDHCVTLPLYHELSQQDQQGIIGMLKRLL